MAEPFIGQVILVGFNFAPRGYAFCDGSVQSIAQNSALFALIGTTYGGNGQTTFALPDLRSRVPIHQGQGPGLQNYVIGQNSGSETVTLTASNLPNHTHLVSATTDVGNAASPANAVIARSSVRGQQNFHDGAATAALASLGSSGGSQPLSIMQPYRAMNYVIAVEGIFPSRN